jgi:hypothetical protein
MLSEEEMETLRLLNDGERPGVLSAASLSILQAYGLVERQLGSWTITSRGYALLLRSARTAPLGAAQLGK